MLVFSHLCSSNLQLNVHNIQRKYGEWESIEKNIYQMYFKIKGHIKIPFFFFSCWSIFTYLKSHLISFSKLVKEEVT